MFLMRWTALFETLRNMRQCPKKSAANARKRNGPLVVETIRKVVKRILSGEYAVGTYLPPERQLCQELEVSCGTLRAALSDLERLGAIERRVGDGTFVRELSVGRLPGFTVPSDITDVTLEGIHFIRRTLEIASIEYCQGCLTAGSIETMEDCVKRMNESLHSLPDFFRYDSQFHRVMVSGCGNPAIYAAYRAIDEYRQFFQVYTTLKQSDEVASLRYHERILASLKSNNGKLAMKYLSDHLDNVLESSGRQKMTKIQIRERKRSGKVYF